MNSVLTEQRFFLSEGVEARILEFGETMSRSELNSRILVEDVDHPWAHATSDDLMDFARSQALQMRELGLKYAQRIGDPDEHLVVALGSTGQTSPACHKLFSRGWSLAFCSDGLWGGEGMFFLVTRSVQK